MANLYELGKVVRCSISFTQAGAGVDPTTVTFTFKDPSGNRIAYVNGVDAQCVKDSTGNYHVDLTTDEAGRWEYRFEGDTPAAGVDEGFFQVEPRTVLAPV